jgi:hypothetical protein
MRGEAVWVSPSVSGQWLSDDEAVVLEDLGAGYMVLQESERVPSHGTGHFVCDLELTALHDDDVVHRWPKVRRLRDFTRVALSAMGLGCGTEALPRPAAGHPYN